MNRIETPIVRPRLFDARVVRNTSLCREHYRLALAGIDIHGARPGQFLHIAPPGHATPPDGARDEAQAMGTSCTTTPLLRRAFSIADLRNAGDGCEIDIIYRVVGTATTWLSSLRAGDGVSVIGPAGNAFPISHTKAHAWMIGGGVGLPPMLWLAEALAAANRERVAFAGARSADLLALTITDRDALSTDATQAAPVASEFAVSSTPVVISTDNGSLGYRGHAAAAMATYFEETQPDASDLVVYTCGPEIMMRAVARFCMDRSIECHVCMERSMACGTGTCQSCVVAVRDDGAVDGWRYELCCTQGPVFDASRVIWPGDAGGGVQH